MRPCSECRYWERVDFHGAVYGRCHRYPDTLNTSEDHWCGEFKITDAEQARLDHEQMKLLHAITAEMP